MSKLLLVAPPWRIPQTPSLALGTLGPILRNAGVEVDELHGSLLFPPVASAFATLEAYAKYLFVPALTGCDVDGLIDRLLVDLLDESNMKGIRLPRETATLDALGVDARHMREVLRHDIAGATACLDATAERMLAEPYDLVGFSATFDDQVPASLALARRLKARRPEAKVMFGGAACFEEQGIGLLASFPEIDVVCNGEGDDVVVPLVAALRGAGSLADVPGVVWRDGATVRRNPPPRLLEHLDALPIPDYTRFIAAFEASHWAASQKPRLMFETSRGCWWGQKSLCTFCGLNAEGLAFRSKSPERAYDEIRTLYERYPTATYLQSTDNILDLGYIDTVFARLAELPRDPDRPLRIFFEVKSNMKREQVEALAAGGVASVQPGIESFSDGVLKLMRKGCTALGQIQFIKWSMEAGIEPIYNVLVRNPGEQAAWYRDMTALVPYLAHLPPPIAVVTMHLERFSPYFQRPAEFGIRGVRPRPYYRDMYPGDGVDLDRIAYQFEFEHDDHDDAELTAAVRECVAAFGVWSHDWRPDLLFYVDDGTRLAVVDRRDGGETVARLTGAAAELFLHLDQHRSRAQIAEAFPLLDAPFVDALLEAWLHRRLVCTDGRRYLCVVPRKGPAVQRVRPTVPRVAPKPRVTLPLAGAG